MRYNLVEALIGAIVLIVAGVFLTFAYSKSQIAPKGGNVLTAKFSHADGVVLGSDVKMSGVKVGTVSDIVLDHKSFMAVVTLAVEPTLELPTDSSAEIISDGLLGNKYISIVPGAEEEILKSGEEIAYTQSSINLESLIGQAIFSGKKE